jgi:acyl-CoA thioester hydrolase
MNQLQSKTVTDSPPKCHVSTVRVRYAETDQMGVVYYANYLIWMEVARVDYCRSIGFHYKDMDLEDGVLLAVAESHCRYVSPARFDEEISIATTVPDVNRRFVSFDYEMTCAGRRVAVGQTRHVFVSRGLDSRGVSHVLRPIRLPDKYAALFDIA